MHLFLAQISMEFKIFKTIVQGVWHSLLGILKAIIYNYENGNRINVEVPTTPVYDTGNESQFYNSDSPEPNIDNFVYLRRN